MKTFTIDEQNSITVFATREEAAGAAGLPFGSQKDLAKLTAEWPVGRFVEIWNGFAGVAPFGELKPVRKFTDRKVAVARIWQAIQRLDAETSPSSMTEPKMNPEPAAIIVSEGPVEITVAPTVESPTPEVGSVLQSANAAETPNVAPQVPDVAPEFPATTGASPAEAVAEPASIEQAAAKQSKRKKTTKPAQDSAAPRETKLSQVVGMLQRPEGATISEIMQRMGWLKHTVRGFMAGTMKKAGYTVESFKPEGGERSYRIPSK
jgi:hypothetical protein